MRSILVAGVVVTLAVSLAGCNHSKAKKVSTTQATAPTTLPTSSPTAQPSTDDSGSGVPTTIDPCELVSRQEAATLLGVAVGAGVEDSVPNGMRSCTYTAAGQHVFKVIVVQAATVEQAKAVKNDMRAEAEQALQDTPLTFGPVAGVGDDAESIHGALGLGVSASGLYVLDGKVGFALVDLALGSQPPTTADLIDSAKTVISRLP